MTLAEKVAHLKGFIQGVELDQSTKEGKVIAAMAEILDEIVQSVSDLDEEVNEIVEQIESIDEDLQTLEDILYDAYDEDSMLYEVTCPKCENTICIDEDMVEKGSIDCPNCGESLEFDMDGLAELDELDGCSCEDCDCDCKEKD